jgi:hypothetical protein
MRDARKLKSESVVISAPMSFNGSALRIFKLTNVNNLLLKWLLLVPLCLFLICMVWVVVVFWYFMFGLLLVPYRLIRRSSRKNKRDKLRHRELIELISEK